MHNCVRCGKPAASLKEIQEGCPCGSKVFVFNRQNSATEEKQEKGGEGRVPESYFVRMNFSSEDVENIKILSEGVFLVDLKSLSKSPLVLKDQEGIYYVKLPVEAQLKSNDGKKGGK
jgi:predicted  nucleic acid-binding Zn-ribbon protein